MSEDRLKRELASFEKIWANGYFEGEVMDPFGVSGYNQQRLGHISVLYATYLKCIKPYIDSSSKVLEIGPGRGAWTKSMLKAQEIQVLDAKSEIENRFFEYLGPQDHVTYHHVSDFDCKMLPDNHFNYLFSYGALCHVSFEGITLYAQNIYPKLQGSSDCFWMIADYEQYNNALQNNLDLANVIPNRSVFAPLRSLVRSMMIFNKKKERPRPAPGEENNEPKEARWYHAGLDRTCEMLVSKGYSIIEEDVGTCPRDPIIHFRKD